MLTADNYRVRPGDPVYCIYLLDGVQPSKAAKGSGSQWKYKTNAEKVMRRLERERKKRK